MFYIFYNKYNLKFNVEVVTRVAYTLLLTTIKSTSNPASSINPFINT